MISVETLTLNKCKHWDLTLDLWEYYFRLKHVCNVKMCIKAPSETNVESMCKCYMVPFWKFHSFITSIQGEMLCWFRNNSTNFACWAVCLSKCLSVCLSICQPTIDHFWWKRSKTSHMKAGWASMVCILNNHSFVRRMCQYRCSWIEMAHTRYMQSVLLLGFSRNMICIKHIYCQCVHSLFLWKKKTFN